MDSVGFILMGTPVPKQRARVTRHGTYTPKETVDAEQRLMQACMSTLDIQVGETVFVKGEAVEMVIDFYLPIPQSWSKKKQLKAQNQELFPTSKPDLDNLVKLVKDALNGVMYVDDSAIVGIKAKKRYGIEPMTMVTCIRVIPSK